MKFNRVHDDDLLNRCLGKDRQDFVQLVIRGKKNGAAAGVLQHERALLRRERRIERDGDSAEQQAGHVGDRPFGTILAQDRDTIALADSPVVQRPGGLRDPPAKFVRGDGKPLSRLAVQQHAVEIALDGGEENVVESGNAHRVFRGGRPMLVVIVQNDSEQNCTVLQALSAMRTITRYGSSTGLPTSR